MQLRKFMRVLVSFGYNPFSPIYTEQKFISGTAHNLYFKSRKCVGWLVGWLVGTQFFIL